MVNKNISACFYHDDKPAVANCSVCLKPICADCLIKNDRGVFCSQTCAANAEKAMTHIEEFDQLNAAADEMERRANRASLIINFSIIFVCIVLFLLAWRCNWIPVDAQKYFYKQLHELTPAFDGFMHFLSGKTL